MRSDLIDSLRCPACAGKLELDSARSVTGKIETAALLCSGCGHQYPVVRGIPRFVGADNYAASFGFQWNEFRRTQLDSVTGSDISRERFLKSTGLGPSDLENKLVLDVGCGAGRFAEIALSLGARVIALDYSTAVDACKANLGSDQNLQVVQGDVYRLPFPLEYFDIVYCLGVLQHTPDAQRAFLELPRYLKSGGKLAVDIYPKLWMNVLWSKYWLRPLTKRLPQQLLFRLVRTLAPKLLPISDFLAKVPGTRRRLRYLVPVANYRGVFPLNEQQLREWSILDTFDMLAPEHDHPRTAATLKHWFDVGGLQNVHVKRAGHLIGYGTKPPRVAQ